MKKNKLFLVLFVSACCFGVHTSNLEAHQHSTPGEKVDDAIDYTKDKVNEAKDKVKDGIDEAKDKIKDGVDKTKDKVKDGLDAAKDSLDQV